MELDREYREGPIMAIGATRHFPRTHITELRYDYHWRWTQDTNRAERADVWLWCVGRFL